MIYNVISSFPHKYITNDTESFQPIYSQKTHKTMVTNISKFCTDLENDHITTITCILASYIEF